MDPSEPDFFETGILIIILLWWKTAAWFLYESEIFPQNVPFAF